MRPALLASLALLLTALAPGALATEGKDSADILGNWTFQTKPYRDGQCVMTGTMRLTPSPESGLYECELTAVEVCSMWGRSVVLQQCQARRIDNQLTIRSWNRSWRASSMCRTISPSQSRAPSGCTGR